MLSLIRSADPLPTFNAFPETTFVMAVLRQTPLPDDIRVVIAVQYHRLCRFLMAIGHACLFVATATHVYLCEWAFEKAPLRFTSIDVGMYIDDTSRRIAVPRNGTPFPDEIPGHTMTYTVRSDYTLSMLQIACGSSHLVVSTTEGVFVWGSNDYGQLGIPSIPSLWGESLLRVWEPAESVDCWLEHTMILSHGSLFACGQNLHGQSGLGSRSNAPTFTRVPIDNVRSFACSPTHTLVLSGDTIYVCERLKKPTQHQPSPDIHRTCRKASAVLGPTAIKMVNGIYATLGVPSLSGSWTMMYEHPEWNTPNGIFRAPPETLLALSAKSAFDLAESLPTQFGTVIAVACKQEVIMVATNRGVFVSLVRRTPRSWDQV